MGSLADYNRGVPALSHFSCISLIILTFYSTNVNWLPHLNILNWLIDLSQIFLKKLLFKVISALSWAVLALIPHSIQFFMQRDNSWINLTLGQFSDLLKFYTPLKIVNKLKIVINSHLASMGKVQIVMILLGFFITKVNRLGWDLCGSILLRVMVLVIKCCKFHNRNRSFNLIVSCLAI